MTCFYTAIFGNIDNIVEYTFDKKGVDYIIFTDNKDLKSDFYKIIYCKPFFSDPVRSAKVFKLLPHLFLPTYDIAIWIDGSMTISEHTINILNLFEEDQYQMNCKHTDRDCIYDEFELCEAEKLDETEIMRNQINRYRKNGYPPHNGLVAMGFIARKNKDPRSHALNERWWDEISNNSRRDQLSFNYVIWKYKFKYQALNLRIWDNEFFSVRQHNFTNRVKNKPDAHKNYKNIKFENLRFKVWITFMKIKRKLIAAKTLMTSFARRILNKSL